MTKILNKINVIKNMCNKFNKMKKHMKPDNMVNKLMDIIDEIVKLIILCNESKIGEDLEKLLIEKLEQIKSKKFTKNLSDTKRNELLSYVNCINKMYFKTDGGLEQNDYTENNTDNDTENVTENDTEIEYNHSFDFYYTGRDDDSINEYDYYDSYLYSSNYEDECWECLDIF